LSTPPSALPSVLSETATRVRAAGSRRKAPPKWVRPIR
jgi:hypothetical protein